MIITTTTIMLVQAIVVTWIMVTAPTPCPQEYLENLFHMDQADNGL